MSQKKDVYVASTFWLNHCSQELGLKEMLRCDFHKYEKFVFPVHCPGHITIKILILGKWHLPDESKPNVHIFSWASI